MAMAGARLDRTSAWCHEVRFETSTFLHGEVHASLLSRTRRALITVPSGVARWRDSSRSVVHSMQSCTAAIVRECGSSPRMHVVNSQQDFPGAAPAGRSTRVLGRARGARGGGDRVRFGRGGAYADYRIWHARPRRRRRGAGPRLCRIRDSVCRYGHLDGPGLPRARARRGDWGGCRCSGPAPRVAIQDLGISILGSKRIPGHRKSARRTGDERLGH